MASGEDIRSYTAEELRLMLERGEDLTDWARVDAKTEEELEADIASDPDWADIPRDWMLSPNAVLVRGLEQRAIVVDRAVAEWFSRQGGDYQARINDVLRAYIHGHSDV
jgi:uncharacterized protein (DUF4415 family)